MNFDRKGFIVVTSALGTREIFYILKENDFPKAQNQDAFIYVRIDEEAETKILKDFFTTLNRSNDNNGTGYEIWKTSNYRFILSHFRQDWEYRKVELMQQFV